MKRALAAALAATGVVLLHSGAHADSHSSVSGVVSVADQLTVHATNIATSEGSAISGPIATLADRNKARPASAFTATVTWGDGTTTRGSVSGSSGQFSVSASHAYREEGSYAITVSVVEHPDGAKASARGRATIADAALSASGKSVNSTKQVHAVVATFTDADPGHRVSDYTARITWGDGSPQTVGSVTAQGGGYAVTGIHQYGHTGFFTVTIVITDAGGAHVTATTHCSIHG